MGSDDEKFDTYDNLVKDDGSGEIKVWRIENFEKVPVDEEFVGHFFYGDSYVILYSYKVNEVQHHIIYFWQGRHSTLDELGASAMLTVELDESMGGSPVQVRVVQGREPPHFRAIFAGRMIVHSGGKASGFRNRNEEDSIDDDGVRLYHVKGTTVTNAYAAHVTEAASSLNSRDCFVLCRDGDEKAIYLWCGRASLPAEKEVASSIAQILAIGETEVTEVEEGEEPGAFWELLGGEGEYPEQRPDEPEPSEPRLFQCSDAMGDMQVTEVAPFTQDDLNNSDVMIMDCGTNLYVWVGAESNEDEQQAAMDIGLKFTKNVDDNIVADAPITVVRAGAEPSFFTQHFIGWDPKFLEKEVFVDPLDVKEEKQKQEEAEEVEEAPVETTKPAEGDAGDDPTRREEALSDEEFVAAFGMSRAEFYELKDWKQIQLKKDAGLF